MTDKPKPMTLRERTSDIDCKAELGALPPDEYRAELSELLGEALGQLDEMARLLKRAHPEVLYAIEQTPSSVHMGEADELGVEISAALARHEGREG